MSPWIRILAVAAALLGTAALGVAAAVAGAWYYFEPSLPSAETLRDVQLQIPLRVYSRDGRLIDQIGEKRRSPVDYEDIPPVVIQAFLAAEDDRFFEHPGFDYQGIMRAALNLLLTGSRSQGGSTITQQLARVYFLSRERTFVRKAKELLLAMQIEREFTKEEILALYLNKIFLGQRAYGVGAAAEVYFGKPLDELTIAEAATIAGIPKAPSRLNPVADVERATERRAYVLRRMHELDFIDDEQYAEALATPVVSKLHGPRVALHAPWVSEMVRAEMIRRFGPAAYTDGYRVVTTIDSSLQLAAEQATRTALLEYDRRHGYRGPLARDALAGLDKQPDGSYAGDALNALLADYPEYGGLQPAVVLGLGEDQSARVFIRDRGEAVVGWDGLRWPRYVNDNVVGDPPKQASDVVRPGDVVYLLPTVDRGWLLAQLPEVQGAMVAVDPEDGAILSLTGGFDFRASKFNRAVQSRRQPGSSFKPFIYSAALENGFTPATLVNDAPVVFDDENLEDTWRPENYSRRFNGPTRLREALVRSLNLVSVRILLGTGIGNAIRHIRKFGLPDSALPRDLSLALGSGGAAPLDMAAGYAVFANTGYRVKPYLIERVLGPDGSELYNAEPDVACPPCDPDPAERARREALAARDAAEPPAPAKAQPVQLQLLPDAPAPGSDEIPDYRSTEQLIAHGLNWRPTASEAPHFLRGYLHPAERVISAENAYLIYDMMRDVIRRGTGRRARDLGRPDLAGKTGTSNDRRDAWFSGFNGQLVATAWVGFDQERSLGAGEEGSRTALPMWKYFMADALRNAPDGTIPRPPGIVTVRIDPRSGKVAPAGYQGAIFEIFEAGHLPPLLREEATPIFSDVDGNPAEPAPEDETLF
ncbi:MAG: penicillin-binding protein 1A [Gammaproteobacteria bacterium]|nr:MAG: penicillin-binding protein 1A [Gammaproteobacteria bacterium]